MTRLRPCHVRDRLCVNTAVQSLPVEMTKFQRRHCHCQGQRARREQRRRQGRSSSLRLSCQRVFQRCPKLDEQKSGLCFGRAVACRPPFVSGWGHGSERPRLWLPQSFAHRRRCREGRSLRLFWGVGSFVVVVVVVCATGNATTRHKQEQACNVGRAGTHTQQTRTETRRQGGTRTRTSDTRQGETFDTQRRFFFLFVFVFWLVGLCVWSGGSCEGQKKGACGRGRALVRVDMAGMPGRDDSGTRRDLGRSGGNSGCCGLGLCDTHETHARGRHDAISEGRRARISDQQATTSKQKQRSRRGGRQRARGKKEGRRGG